MKLYIPTSSLNIDNILSSESIAPYSLYKHRKFGYQTFVKIEDIPFDNGILLFSSIPNFSINDRTRDNFPLIIELEDDAQFQDITPIATIGECDIYFWKQSIHISPTNTKILFFTQKAKSLSLQNCLDSKMCKLVDFYKFDICAPSRLMLSEIRSAIKVIDDSPNKDIIDENLHDRAKGFVFGYYMGAGTSVSEVSAKLARIQKRIYDIVASITNSQERRNILLEDELKNLDKEYESLDPTSMSAKAEWEQFVSGFGLNVASVNAFLGELHLETKAKTDFCNKQGIVFRKTYSQCLNLASYNIELQKHVEALLRADRQKSLDKTEIKKELDINPDYELSLVSGTDETSSLFNSILIKIIWENLIPNFDELRINRFSIATEITKIVKDILIAKGKEWDNSSEQLYFYHLRQNIQDFTPFNLNEIGDIVLQSLVAIILKGEDFEALISYLESNNISDFRYSLAMWGALQGYIRIPRSIFSEYIKKESLQTLLSDVNEILYKSRLQGNLDMHLPTPVVPKPEIDTSIETLSEQNPIETWRNFIRENAMIAMKGKRNQEKLKLSLEQALLAVQGNTDNFLFITLLNDFDGWKPTKSGPCAAWQQLQKLIAPDYYDRTNGQRPKEQSRSLWDRGLEFLGLKDKEDEEQETIAGRSSTPTKQEKSKQSPPVQPTIDFDEDNSQVEQRVKRNQYIAFDDYAWTIIAQAITNEKMRDKIRGDWEWFIGEIRTEPAEKRKFYSKLDNRNNENVIYSFCNLKKDKVNYFPPELRLKIRELLMRIYCNK